MNRSLISDQNCFVDRFTSRFPIQLDPSWSPGDLPELALGSAVGSA